MAAQIEFVCGTCPTCGEFHSRQEIRRATGQHAQSIDEVLRRGGAVIRAFRAL